MAREPLRKAVSDLTLEKLILQGENLRAIGPSSRANAGNRRSPSAKLPSPGAAAAATTSGRRSACPRGWRAACWGDIPRRGERQPRGRANDAALAADIVALTTQYGRYGHRRIMAMLQAVGRAANVRRIARRGHVRHWSEDTGRAAPGGAGGAGESSQRVVGSGRTTAPASGSDPRGPTPSGPTTSSRTARTTAGSCAGSTSSTRSPANASRSASTGS